MTQLGAGVLLRREPLKTEVWGKGSSVELRLQRTLMLMHQADQGIYLTTSPLHEICWPFILPKIADLKILSRPPGLLLGVP